MHFDWIFRRRRNGDVAESLIPWGFLEHVSLLLADNVHARFWNPREAVDALSRFPFAWNHDFANALFLPLIPANSARKEFR
jgi:hypothetical protein